jgi:polyisoprenoid-binding protein YceI
MTRYVRLISTALLVLSFVEPISATVTSPKPVSEWMVDQSHSKLGFVALMNGQSFGGQFRHWAAQIRFDPNRLDASNVRVLIDTASAVTADQSRDQSLPTADWFAVQTFPRATFTSRHLTSLGGGHYRVDGDLRIRDVSRPVSFPFQVQIQGKNARMAGRLSIDRTTFGVGQGQFKGTETIAAKVDVVITIAATKNP